MSFLTIRVSGATGFDTHGLDESHHLGAENRVSVKYQVLWRRIEGERLTQLLDHPCRSRIKCRVEMKIRRRLWSMTKNPYKTLSEAVGTVNKSIAAITSL